MSHDASNDPLTEPDGQGELGILEGELTTAPRSAWLTVLLALTGLLVVIEGGRALARLVLALRRPAFVRLSAAGLEVRGSTTLLGRVLREHISVIPLSALMHATREVRYPRLGLYAGLVALTAGSYAGVGLAVDGLRASSPSLLGAGISVVLLGLLLDFAFTSILPGVRGRARLLLLPRRGKAVCLASVDPSAADAFLRELAGSLEPPASTARESIPSRSGTDAAPGEAEREAAEQPR